MTRGRRLGRASRLAGARARDGRRALRGAARVALAALALAAGPARAAAPGSGDAPWEALYRDATRPAPIVLDLSLTGTTAHARLLLPGRSETLPASGTAGADGSLRLTVRDAQGHELGVLEGRRSQAPNDDGRTFLGRLTLGGTGIPLAMTRFAQIVTWRVREGAIDVEVRYPHFESSDLASLNAVIEPHQHATLASFLAEGRQAEADGGLFHGWQLLADTRLQGLVGTTVSLLGEAYRYTGGAHGNTTFAADTWQLDGPPPRTLSLADLFRPGTPYLARLEPRVLADLRAQNATWVVDGEVTALTAQDLALFTLAPAGLTFTFPPYAMGPYAEGTFTVVVPYADVVDLALPGGPLAAYAGAAR